VMSPKDRVAVAFTLVNLLTHDFGHADGSLMFTTDQLREWIDATQKRVAETTAGAGLDLKELLLWVLSLDALTAVDSWVAERGVQAYKDVQWMLASVAVLGRALTWDIPAGDHFAVIAARVQRLEDPATQMVPVETQMTQAANSKLH
jgi:hypothetical protein